MTTITGTIIFEGGPPESIPDGSLLIVKFQDTNLADAPAITLGEYVQTINNYQSGEELGFFITADRRPPHGMRGSLRAVLNIGWTPSGNDWLRRGDWLNDTRHSVNLSSSNEYYCDVTIRKFNR